jgi:hypothetical protein
VVAFAGFIARPLTHTYRAGRAPNLMPLNTRDLGGHF